MNTSIVVTVLLCLVLGYYERLLQGRDREITALLERLRQVKRERDEAMERAAQ